MFEENRGNHEKYTLAHAYIHTYRQCVLKENFFVLLFLISYDIYIIFIFQDECNKILLQEKIERTNIKKKCEKIAKRKFDTKKKGFWGDNFSYEKMKYKNFCLRKL